MFMLTISRRLRYNITIFFIAPKKKHKIKISKIKKDRYIAGLIAKSDV